MALILNIDTALDSGYVVLAHDGQFLKASFNDQPRDHASWLQPAIQQILKDSGVEIRNLDAVGVSVGPGSYTGLRIGLSAAKGLCFALNIPLLTENSLKLLAFSAIKELGNESFEPNMLITPMIDARRMEVFTAIYAQTLEEILRPSALELTPNSFEELLGRQKMLFLGNGSAKFESICQNSAAIFRKIDLAPQAISSLTYKNFIGNNFADLAYTEPLYGKEFFHGK